MTFQFDPDLLFGLLFTGAGAAIVLSELREFSRSMASEDWSPVEGEVEEAEVATTYSPQNRSTYSPQVRYHYAVQGTKYASDRIAFGGRVSTSWRGYAEKVVDRYRRMGKVKVYVSPDDPALAVLEPGIHWICLVALAIGTIFLGLGIALLVPHLHQLESLIHFK